MPLLLLVVKSSAVLLSALAAAAVLGRSAAATRHRLWSVAFALVLAVPALALVLPALNVTLPVIQPPAIAVKGSEGQLGFSSLKTLEPPISSDVSSGTESVSRKADRLHGPSVPFMVEMIWAFGCLAALASLVLSLVRVSRLSRRSDELSDGAWQSASSKISAQLGLSAAPRLVVSERVMSPMAGGVFRPTVFLPSGAPAWDDERRDVVLTHEIAHLASRDPLRHLIARAAVACYWFHPLAWLAAHRATVCREQACDEAVLAAGTRPSAYARVLLELAEGAGAGAASLTALPMAQRSNLEKRLMTILNGNRRPSSNRSAGIAAVILAGITLSAAAVRPSAAVVPITGPLPLTVIEQRGGAAAPVTGATTTAESAAMGEPVMQSTDGSLADQCRWRGGSGSINFSGSTTNISGTTMMVQQTLDGVRVCVAAAASGDRADRPSQWLERSTHLVMSSERDGQTQELEQTRTGGAAQTVFRVNGRERAFDAAAREWRDSLLAVLDTTWEASQIRGEVSSLRGEISSVRGRESSLRGEISSIHGEVSSMQGQISSVRGQESSMRGQISSIHGRLSSLRGEISSEEGAISSLNARRYDVNAAEDRRIQSTIDDHRKRIEAIEKQIDAYDAEGKVREVQQQIDRFNADDQIRAIQKKIEAYEADQKVSGVQRQIESLKVDDQVREIQQRIESLHADDRVREIEGREPDLLRRLRAAIAAIR